MALNTPVSPTSSALTQPGRRRTLRGRIARVLIPATMAVFVIIGVIGAWFFIQESRAVLRDQQAKALATMSAAASEFVAQQVNLTQNVADSVQVLRFSEAVLAGDSVSAADAALGEMLASFSRTMERYYPDVFGIFYVTDSGSIWGSVEIGPDGEQMIVREPFIDALVDDPARLAALEAPPGQAVARPIELRADYTTTGFDIAPVMRIYLPVERGGADETGGGVIAVDVRATALLDNLSLLQEANQNVLGDTRSLMVDTAGHVLFDSTRPFVAEVVNPTNTLEQSFPSINAVLGTQEALVLAAAGEEVISTEVIRLPGRDDAYLRLIAINDLSVLQEAGLDRALFVLGGAVISGVLLSLITWWVLGRYTRPVARFAEEVAAGAALPATSPDASDELGTVMAAYARLREENDQLTELVADQNRRFTRTFDIAARVSSEAAALTRLDDLLNRTIDQICREYGFYHAQVFLLDDVGQNAVLVYSYGEAGRQLLERKHRLAVGSNSLVGQAAETGFPMIVNDTSEPGDAPWRFNPLLPDTRAEMALPLNIGDAIIGVLDLQSVRPNAFEAGDMQAYLLLTDQIAIAVNNARLLEQSHQRIEQIDILNRQLTRGAWEETSAYAAGQAYVYDLMTVQDADAAPITPAGPEIPIAIRGEVVGNLRASAETWSSDDEALLRAVADRVGIALENARLFEQTETALGETRRLYAATRAITAAATPADVFSAAAEHLSGAAPATTRLTVLLATPTQTADAPYYEIGYVWTSEGDAGEQTSARLAASTIPLARIAERAGGLLMIHTADELAGEPALQAFLGQHASESAVLTPVRTRQRWFGLVLIESALRRVYDDDYARFAVAVADQMAVALEGLTLFNEAQDQALRALALAEAGQLASRVGAEFTESLGRVFERIAEVARYDRWELLLLDESGENLLPVLSRFGDMPEILGEAFAIDSDAPLAAVYREHRPLLINDPVGFPLYANLSLDDIERLGKHILYPVRAGDKDVGVLSIGRSLDDADLDERDEQLVVTLAAQIGISVENRRLFLTAENERQTLRTILETLPAGVLVLDPVSFKPLQTNAQAQQLLGDAVTGEAAVTVETLHMFRAGDGAPYPAGEMPIFAAAQRKQQVASDDIVVRGPDGSETALLVNAAPLVDAQGTVSAIVVAFEDITPLRSLESSLQVTLRDTVALYESTRALAEAEETDDVLDQVITRLAADEPSEIYVLLLDEQEEGARVARSLSGQRGAFPLPADLLANQTVAIRDVGRSRLNRDIKAALAEADVQALLSLPLRSRSRRDVPLGWLVLTYARPVDLASREQFISTLAESAAVALDNRALFRGTQVALQETAALYNATSAISASRDLASLTEAVKSSLEQLNPDLYAAVLVSDGTPVDLFNFNLDGAPVDFGALMVGSDALRGPGSLFVDDLRAVAAPTPFEQRVVGLGTVRALGLVPLRIQGEPAGALIVGYHQPRRFSSGDVRYLSAAADSASVVADNILLLDQIQANLRETSVLYEATRALADASTPADVLDIAQRYLGAGRVTQAFIALLNRGDWNLPDSSVNVVASWQADENSLPLEGVMLSPEQFPAWSLLTTPEVLAVSDTHADTRVGALEAVGLESLDFRAVAILPLRGAGRSLGALVLGSREPSPFLDSDVRVFSAFAEQAGLRLEASRLVLQTERRARQLATSAQVSSIASSILDLNFLLPRLVDTIRDQFDYDHVQIFLMDERDEFAVLRASTGEAGRQLLEQKHRLQRGSQSVIGQVTASARPVIASDTADARVVHRPNPLLPNTRSEMAIPLILKGRVVGALDVQSGNPNYFDDDDVAVLTTLAAQISVAIDNAQLFEQSSQRASEMSFLFGVTNAAASSESLNEALQSVAGQLVTSLNALAAAVYLPQTLVDGLGEEQQVLRPVALAGVDGDNLVDVPADSATLLAQVARDRAPQILNTLDEARGYDRIAEAARSALLVPLTSGAQLTGIVLVESEVANAFSAQTLTLMRTLAGSLAAIIQNQQLLEQMQATNEQLRELDKLKSDFLANMSHELRTPLNSIIGFSKVILKGIDGPLTEMQEQDLSTIYSSGIHLLNLINDILDQSKIAAGKMDLHFDYFDMKSVIDAVRSIGIGLVKDKPINIHVEIGPGLPRAYGDELRTRQVLINLMSNAAKFTREGAITMRAYKFTDADTGRDMVRADVIDSGIGISRDDIPLLFEAFRQVDSSLTRTVGGTGLGLPIARSLIEIMGGRMEVESVPNVGSTFSVILPTEPVTADDAPPEEAPETAAAPTNGSRDTLVLNKPTPAKKRTDEVKIPASLSGSTAVGKRQALLIEDNPDMVDQYRRLLQREGFDVFTASIPLEAEAMASGLHPTVIIMEASFADGASWDILSRLKARDDTGDIPVIIVSLADVAQKAVEAGAYRTLRRPFGPESLVQALSEAERESRTERILIIDDQPDSVRLLSEVLSEQGRYRVFSAGSGPEGIALVARRRPDLILLDLRMPAMDGFAVIEELRGNPETMAIPILVVTNETINPAEMERLNDLHVLYKTDLLAGIRREFMDEVRASLTNSAAGVM
jgi:GAF domain-containing protein/CheY-like chemotaxis protein